MRQGPELKIPPMPPVPEAPLPTKGAHSVSHLLREVCRSRSPRSLTTETNFMPTPFRHFGTPVGTRTATRTAPKVYPSFWRAGNAWCGGKLEPLAGGWKNSYPKPRGFSRLGGWLSELPRLVRWDCDSSPWQSQALAALNSSSELTRLVRWDCD